MWRSGGRGQLVRGNQKEVWRGGSGAGSNRKGSEMSLKRVPR